MQCVLIYNPSAGGNRQGPDAIAKAVAVALHREGHSVLLSRTSGPGHAIKLAREAADVADVIFAGGGDGTVNEVLQGMMDAANHRAALGIVPLGTANALARHLHLPHDPIEAALLQVRGVARSVSVGRISHAGGTRYFLAMAGAGPDGELAYQLGSTEKAKAGRVAYYAASLRIFLTQRFRAFDAEVTRAGGGAAERRQVVAAMTVRVRSMGGIYSGLTDARATLTDTTLPLYLLSRPAWLALPLWFVLGWLRVPGLNPLLHRVQASAVTLRPIGGKSPRAQIDGEAIGALPVELSLVPAAVRILMPSDILS